MNPIAAIAAASLIAGILDISATGTLLRLQGVPFQKLLQRVAGGVMGPTSVNGGNPAAALGLLLHFFIATAATSIYYILSQHFGGLLTNPLLYGALYGVVVHLVMSLVVIPLSRVPPRPFSSKAFIIQLVIHICLVGIPIALTLSHFLR
jgi:uncharacterized membrane protein YagU involved in acid resistance